MKRIKYFMPVLMMTAALAAGCSGGKTDREVAEIPDGDQLTPAKIVERLFAAFQFGELTGAEAYFSEEIDPEIASKFVRSFFDKRAVMKFKTFETANTGGKATIKLLYSYQEKASQGPARNNVAQIFVNLVKEGNVWKIRGMGMPEFDDVVEKYFFNKCLNAVMDATIAQEKLRLKEDKYSTIIGSLIKFHPIDEKACEEMAIEKADRKTYLISAITKNSPPCLITGNTDSHFPRSFDECPGTTAGKDTTK